MIRHYYGNILFKIVQKDMASSLMVNIVQPSAFSGQLSALKSIPGNLLQNFYFPEQYTGKDVAENKGRRITDGIACPGY